MGQFLGKSMAILDGHDGASLLFHLDRDGTRRSSEKLLGTTSNCSVRVTKSEADYNIYITNQLGAKMHIITFTNSYGCKRVIELPAEQIKAVLELCTTLQNEKINYSHIFEE
jgi:hypothetical protein